MIRIGLKMICLSAFLLMSAYSRAEANIPDIVSKQRDTVVTIYVDDKNGAHIDSGTGFVVDPDGVIATNCRILAKWLTVVGATLSVEIEGSRLPVEDVISSKCENNLALLRIKTLGLNSVKMSGDYRPRQGDNIFVIKGQPGSSASVSPCTIRSVNDKSKSFQISAGAAGKESGSPLFNVKGEAVGAVIVQSVKGKNLVFGVSVKDILKQLDRYRKPKTLMEKSISHPKTEKEPEKKAGDVHEYFSTGCAYDQLGTYREAVDAYRRAIEIDPGFVDSYLNLGVDYYRLGKYDDAINAFNQAIRVKPDLISAYNKLGAIYIVEGKYSMAVEAFRKAILIDPANSTAHFNLGIAYFLSGDSISASSEYTILKDMDKAKADSLADLIY